jgi:cellobiose-specific phosphotransferase system component IIB
MPFALVPEGFKLQKVTKAQQKAVDQYYNNKSTQAFLEGDASSELVKVAAIVVTPIVLAALAKQLKEIAEEQGIDINTEELAALSLRFNPVTLPVDVAVNLLRRFDFITEEQEAEIREKTPII